MRESGMQPLFPCPRCGAGNLPPSNVCRNCGCYLSDYDESEHSAIMQVIEWYGPNDESFEAPETDQGDGEWDELYLELQLPWDSGSFTDGGLLSEG